MRSLVGSVCLIAILLPIIVTAFSVATAQSSDGLESMKLLTNDVGWAATERHLFWTTDGGENWNDVTPSDSSSAEIASVFFLDATTGWVLVSIRDANTNDVSGFDLAFTTDGGSNWTNNHIWIPNFDPRSNTLAGDARLHFVDSAHGWMNVGVVGSAAFNPGFLLKTVDGGRTWQDTPLPLGLKNGGRGSVRFVNPRTGWFTNDSELYVTLDGTNTWQEVSLKPPRELTAINPTYGLPIFPPGDFRGFLPVTYSGPRGSKSVLVLFTSEDGGRTWKIDRMLPDLRETSIGQTFPIDVFGSTAITAIPSGPKQTLVTKVTPEGYSNVSAELAVGVSAFSFSDSFQGWALTTDRRLVLTVDGGATWTNITPRVTYSSGSAGFSNSAPAATSSLPKSELPDIQAAPKASVSRHVGFDKQFVAKQSAMSEWWTHSPYYDVGFYPNGGFNRKKTDTNLDSRWITDIEGQGWGLMPVWVDYQSPCACKYGDGTFPNCTYGPFHNVINKSSTNNYQAAYNQGVQSANCAAASVGRGSCRSKKLTGLGLAGTVIYVDIEGYDPSYVFPTGESCGAAVNRFLSGWMSQIEADNYTSGSYGNPAPAASWNKGSKNPPYSAVSPLPSDIWVAKSDNRVTIWGMGYGMTDSMWRDDQRIHQYKKNKDETWPPGGTVTLHIDGDIENATIVAGNGSKTYSFSYTSIDCGATYTEPQAINNKGLVVGYYGTNNGDRGFTYQNGTCTPFPYSNGDTHLYGVNNRGQIVGTAGRMGFLYSNGVAMTITCKLGTSQFPTIPEAVNDDGQIAGFYHDSNGIEQGFLWKPNGTCTSINDGAFQTDIFGVTGYTDLVGMYQSRGGICPSNGVCYYGFLKHGITAPPMPVQFPSGASNCDSSVMPPPPCYWVSQINNNEEIVGYWTDYSTSTTHGFLDLGGQFLDIDCRSSDCPNVTSTSAYGINDATQNVGTEIVGSWMDSSFRTHGFVATRTP